MENICAVNANTIPGADCGSDHDELWKKIKMTIAKIAKEKCRANVSGRNSGTLDERRNMKAHGKNVNNPGYKEKSRAIRKVCTKDNERYTEDKCVTIVELCKHGGTSKRHEEMRALKEKRKKKNTQIK